MIVKPIQLENPDLSDLREICQEYIDYVFEDPDYNEDRAAKYDYYIYDEAISAIFGKDVWNNINERIEEIESRKNEEYIKEKLEIAKQFIKDHEKQ
jgi:DNA modification methylase